MAKDFFVKNVFFEGSGNGGDGPSPEALQPRTGFIDYNNTISPVAVNANEWTTLPNDGLGSFTNKAYPPTGVSELMDQTTGAIDPKQLSLGDFIVIRNDFTIVPTTNNAKLEFRYSLGGPGQEYVLETAFPRMDSGAGIGYRFSLRADLIYMGDENTRSHPIILQVRVGTDSEVFNAGSVVVAVLREVGNG